MPPCDLPYIELPDRRPKTARGRVKQSDDDRKLEAAQQLNIEQYAKRRYAVPLEVQKVNMRALGKAVMDLDSDADAENGAGEECVLRLNFDAFAVHFRHQHCVEFITAAQGPECSRVAQATLELSLTTDLDNIGKPEHARRHCAVSVAAIAQRAAELAAEAVEEDDNGGASGADGSAGHQNGASGSSALRSGASKPERAGGATGGMELDAPSDVAACEAALATLEDMAVVQRAGDAAYVFDQRTSLHAVRSPVPMLAAPSSRSSGCTVSQTRATFCDSLVRSAAQALWHFHTHNSHST